VTDEAVRAAGGVLWREGPVVAIVHRGRYDDWSFPKGKLDPGEHPLVAACREVVEETGLQPVVGPRLPSTRYTVDTHDGGLAGKDVDYWAMRADGGEFVANDEVDDLRWLPPAEALSALTYTHDRDVLSAFATLPVPTTTIVLVRHARAGRREEWTGEDDLRPLDDRGREQARRLGEILPWYGPRRIVSADKVRCVETVRPTAEKLGLDVVVDPRWDEEAHGRDPDRAARLVRALAETGEPAVVCSQGGLIPDTVALLAYSDGIRLSSTRTRKGNAWALSFAGSRLVAADCVDPDD
jgi:8-oxo-dGTP pyrophosphatase MutT (NUDIX family)/phosphohistidine phosphatase SixA